MQHACDLRGTGQGNTLKGGGGISMFCFVCCVIKEKGFSLYPSEFLGETPSHKRQINWRKTNRSLFTRIPHVLVYMGNTQGKKRASL